MIGSIDHLGSRFRPSGFNTLELVNLMAIELVDRICELNPAEPNPGEPNPGEPNPAERNLAEPNPAEPNLAEPCRTL